MNRERSEWQDEAPPFTGDRTATGTEVLERAAGRSGELVLRRHGEHLQIVADGTFLISSENVASSIALVEAGVAALEHSRADRRGDRAERDVRDFRLQALIGGLGLGYALDAALREPRIEHVTVAEYEPVVVDWFRGYGAPRADSLARAEAAGRARVVVGDVADVMRANPGTFDLVALDTDNGPDWLVREGNAGLYDEAGLALAHGALRPGGVVVFWSPEHYPWFGERLARAFSRVDEIPARDHVGDRTHEYTMYVARRE